MLLQGVLIIPELIFYIAYAAILFSLLGMYEYAILSGVMIRIQLWIEEYPYNDDNFFIVLDIFNSMFGCVTFSVLLTPVIKAVFTLVSQRSFSKAVCNGMREAMLLPDDVFEAMQFLWLCANGRLRRHERFLQFCQGMQIVVGWFWMYGYFSVGFNIMVILPFVFCYQRCFFPAESFPVNLPGVFLVAQMNLLCTNVCFHRYFAHNVFNTSRLMQFVLALMGGLGGQRGALWWAGIHREHHKHCDTNTDIHSPYYGGFFWAHCGWLFDRHSYTIPRQNVRHLERTYELWLSEPFIGIVSFAAQVYFGHLFFGLSRTDVTLALSLSMHLEFCINSFCHVGTKGDKGPECNPRDIIVLGLVNGGEGYHGGHHERPWCAKHGWRCPWWALDFSYICICILERLCLAWNVQHPGQPDTRSARDVDKIVNSYDENNEPAWL